MLFSRPSYEVGKVLSMLALCRRTIDNCSWTATFRLGCQACDAHRRMYNLYMWKSRNPSSSFQVIRTIIVCGGAKIKKVYVRNKFNFTSPSWFIVQLPEMIFRYAHILQFSKICPSPNFSEWKVRQLRELGKILEYGTPWRCNMLLDDFILY